MTIIQIEITNVCDKSCSNCTRFCGHYTQDKSYFIDPGYFEKAVISLNGFPGIVGMIGGEPTLHPEFELLCKIITRHVPNIEQRGLWSNVGGNYQKHSEIIQKTFGYLNLNDHASLPIIHTPILTASEDFIRDGRLSETEWRYFTDKCWIQMTWSATITPKGAYFCEVAGMLDYLFDGSHGWDIVEDPSWWEKPVADYASQVEWACRKCGCQLPLRPRRSNEIIDDVTATNLQRLQDFGSPKVAQGKYEMFIGDLDRNQVRDSSWYWNRKKRNIFIRTLSRLRREVSKICKFKY